MSTTATSLSLNSGNSKITSEELITQLISMTHQFNKQNDSAGLYKIQYLANLEKLVSKSDNAILFNDCELTDEHLDLIFAVLERNTNPLGTIQFAGNQQFSIPKLEQLVVQLFTKNPNAAYCLTLPPEISFKPVFRRFWNITTQGGARILSPEPTPLFELGMGRGQITKEKAADFCKENMDLIQQEKGHLNFLNCQLTDQDLEVLFNALKASNGSFSALNLTGNHSFSMEVLSKHVENLFAHMKQKNPQLLLCVELPYEFSTHQAIRNAWAKITAVAPGPCRILSFEPETFANLRRFLKANPSITAAMVEQDVLTTLRNRLHGIPMTFTSAATAAATATVTGTSSSAIAASETSSTAKFTTAMVATTATTATAASSTAAAAPAEKCKING